MTPHTRRTRRAFGAALATSTLLIGSAACASDAGDGAADLETDAVDAGQFEATAAYLHQAAEQSTAEGYRMEMLFSLTGEIDDSAPPFMSGEVDGDRYHFVMDLSSLMGQVADVAGEDLPGEMGDLDLTMEMAGDPAALYLRAPMFADLAGLAPSGADLGPMGAFADLGDGWGYVDMEALGEEVPSDVAAALGGQGVDPQAVVAVVEGADDVQDLGAGDVRGTPVHGLSAEVTLADLMAASGQDPEAMAEAAGVGDSDLADALYDTTTPIEVWIDDDGYLRRMAFAYTTDDIADAIGTDTGELGEIGLSGMQFSYAIDMFDYGTPVDFEAPADAVDITEEFTALAGM